MNIKLLATMAASALLSGCLGGIPNLDCNDNPRQCTNMGPPPAPTPVSRLGDGSSIPAYPPAPVSCCPVNGPHPPACPVC